MLGAYDDAIWISGPDEGFGIVMMRLEETFDGSLKVDE